MIHGFKKVLLLSLDVFIQVYLIADWKISNLELIHSIVRISKWTWVNLSIHRYLH